MEYEKVQGCIDFLWSKTGQDQYNRTNSANGVRIQFAEDLTLEFYERIGKKLNEMSVVTMLQISTFDYEPEAM